MPVTGQAWFDHQWGDFIAVGGGGWDWFAVNLADGTDVTLSLVRDATGGYPLVYGTLVAPGRQRRAPDGGRVRGAGDRATGDPPPRVRTTRQGGASRCPAEALVIDLAPTVAAQELDTRATTGVIYWEGSQVVTATRDGRAGRG